jgi:hypothetical protein
VSAVPAVGASANEQDTDTANSAISPDYEPVAGDVVESAGKIGLLFECEGEMKWICRDIEEEYSLIKNYYNFLFLGESCLGVTSKVVARIESPPLDWEQAGKAFIAYFSKPTFTGSYEEQQKQWVEHHGLKVGSKVKVVRKAEDYEGGYGHPYSEGKDKNIGDVSEITNIANGYICLLGWCFPYMVLEPA